VNYTPKDKATIIHLSALLFTQQEIEILMDEEYGETFAEMQTKGQLQSEYEIRKVLYSKAKNGDMEAIGKWTILKSYLAR